MRTRRRRRVAFLPSFWEAAPVRQSPPAKLVARPVARLQGRIRVPGDKSISHRALMFGALAVGETHITGLLEGEDVLRTAAAHARARAPRSCTDADGPVARRGRRRRRVGEPPTCSTWAIPAPRRACCAASWQAIPSSRLHDRRRHPAAATDAAGDRAAVAPAARASRRARAGGCRWPSRAPTRLLPLEYRLPVASAQVKSAVLLCGLNAPGVTTVIEPEATRDHTENMLRHFGAEVRVEAGGAGRSASRLRGQPELRRRDVVVPGDPSSAAFPSSRPAGPARAATSHRNVGLNPLRAGLYRDAERDGRRHRRRERARRRAASRSATCASTAVGAARRRRAGRARARR